MKIKSHLVMTCLLCVSITIMAYSQSLNLKRSTPLPNYNLLAESTQATTELIKVNAFCKNEVRNNFSVISIQRDKHLKNNAIKNSEYKSTDNKHKWRLFLSKGSLLDFNLVCAQPHQIAVTYNNSIFNSQYQ